MSKSKKLSVFVMSLVLMVSCTSTDDGESDSSNDGGSETGSENTGSGGESGSDEGSGISSTDTESESGEGTVTPECEAPGPWLSRSTSEQITALNEGRLCCAELSDAYQAEISSRDVAGEQIASLLSLNEKLEADVQAIEDSDLKNLPLRCVLLGIKDNIDIAGFATTAGSLAMRENVIAEDAPAIKKLRDAGAIFVGKTNLSEWANYRGVGSTSGWSSLGGQTKNGFNPDYNPCGSSSGSAAAVAAGLVSAAIGTETAGSITCPATVNGIVGMKPTIGLVSRSGIVPISHSFDTAGPMTRSVRDAALLLETMAGKDPLDPATDAIPDGFDFAFSASLEAASLAGKTLGYDSSFTSLFSAPHRALFEQQLQKLEEAGASLVNLRMPNAFFFSSNFSTVLSFEFKADLNAYLDDHQADGVPIDLGELIDFNNANSDEVMPYFGQELFLQSQMRNGLDDEDYQQALEDLLQAAGPDGLFSLFESHELDAIVLPTTTTAWQSNYRQGDPGGPSAAFWPAAARSPHLTVPIGKVDELPVGISFIGMPWEDAAILQLGHTYEQIRDE